MNVIVLAGGSDQIALIQELRRQNASKIILVDYYENPPAKGYADKHIAASTLDIDAVRDIAAAEKADLICTACTDQALLTVAKVSEDLSLPCYISYEKALNVTNKSYMKKVMRENGIPTSRYVILDRYLPEALEDFEYPLVVKPVDCNSSKGVRKVYTLQELQPILNEAIAYSRTKTAIVEEYKEGTEISADFYIEDGKVKYLCATTSAKIRNEHSFTICGSIYPAVSAENEKALTRIAQDIADAFEIKDAPLLVQLIMKNDMFDVIEFSARMGGGSKYKLIESLSGVNIMAEYVSLVLGKSPRVNPAKTVNFAVMNYIYCSPGTITGFEGFEELRSEGVIDHYFFYKTLGMGISSCETSGDRAAGYLVTAADEEELKMKISHADGRLKVIDANGMDIMIHEIWRN